MFPNGLALTLLDVRQVLRFLRRQRRRCRRIRAAIMIMN
jgi:hypothetical protein